MAREHTALRLLLFGKTKPPLGCASLAGLSTTAAFNAASIWSGRGLFKTLRVRCGQAPEDTAHIFIHCGFASRFWGVLGVQIDPGSSNVLLSLLRPPTVPAKHYNMFVLLCCWQLWKRRNDVVFRGERSPLATTMSLCRAEAELWKCRLRQEDHHIVTAWCRVFCVT